MIAKNVEDMKFLLAPDIIPEEEAEELINGVDLCNYLYWIYPAKCIANLVFELLPIIGRKDLFRKSGIIMSTNEEVNLANQLERLRIILYSVKSEIDKATRKRVIDELTDAPLEIKDKLQNSKSSLILMQYFINECVVCDANLREFESMLRSTNAHRAANRLGTLLDFLDTTAADSSSSELLRAINQGKPQRRTHDSFLRMNGKCNTCAIFRSRGISIETEREENSAFRVNRLRLPILSIERGSILIRRKRSSRISIRMILTVQKGATIGNGLNLAKP